MLVYDVYGHIYATAHYTLCAPTEKGYAVCLHSQYVLISVYKNEHLYDGSDVKETTFLIELSNESHNTDHEILLGRFHINKSSMLYSLLQVGISFDVKNRNSKIV